MDHVKWDQDTRYTDILREISKERLWEYTQQIARYRRETGSEGERLAMEYIQKTLEGYGVPAQMLKFDLFLGLPEDGEIAVSALGGEVIHGRPPSFSAPTPKEGLVAELVYVGNGSVEELNRVDIRGKLAFLDSIAAPPLARQIEDRGAIGQIYCGGENIREMIVTSIWGTPTPETAWRIPRSHILSVSRKDGERLKGALSGGKTSVRLTVNTFVGWKPVHMVVADIRGSAEPERYTLLGGHVDSWHYGATDNGTTNAAMIETARVLNLNRSKLRRGLKIGFWTGHSQGRYAGSTWYADNHWEDLYNHCVGNITFDLLGGIGCDNFAKFPRLASTKACGARAIGEITGQRSEGIPFGRAGDQSFWGIGIPSLFGVLSRPREDQPDVAAGLKSLLGDAGFPWWWHTIHDTIDKVDHDILFKGTQVMSLAACYFCMNTILPLDFVEAGQEIVDLLRELNGEAGERFSLDNTIRIAETFVKKSGLLYEAIHRVDSANSGKTESINRTLMKLSRTLVPIVQTAASPFDHDLALPFKRLPALQPVRNLKGIDPVSGEPGFIKARLVRERNRVEHALLEAGQSVEAALKEL